MFFGVLAGMPLLLSSCGGAPYVHNVGEFNRQSDYYLNGVSDREIVNVCYAKRKTTPRIVSDLAIAECRKFGKVAVYSKTSYAICPLNTPVAAIYQCASQETLNRNAGS